MSFTLRQGVDRVGREPARVTNLRIDRGTGGAETDREVALAVHRRTAHPAPGRVGLIGAFLEDGNRTRRNVAELKPANAGDAARADSEVANQRFVVAKVAIGEPEHKPVADAIEFVRRSYA